MTFSDLFSQEPALIAGLGAVFAVFAYSLFETWRDERRRRAGREVRSTLAAMVGTIAALWALCAVCLAAWLGSGRALSDLGLGPGEGWGAIAAWVLATGGAGWLLADALRAISNAGRRKRLAEQLSEAGGLEYFDLRNLREAAVFQGLAVTAGVTEEIIFRGFVLLTLSLVLPFWAAVLASAAIFILFHAYQGAAGMMRIIPMAAILTALVILGGTLWPAILVHIVADMAGGIMLWGARVEWGAQRGAVR